MKDPACVMLSARSQDPDGNLDISQLSELSGLSVRNLRAYLQMGLLHPAVKRGRSLMFDQSHVRRLEQIGGFQARGYSLAAIKDVLSGGGDALLSDDVAQVSRLIDRWLGDDNHHWTIPELMRLLPEGEDEGDVRDGLQRAGIARRVLDGLIISRPEQFRAGIDLTAQGVAIDDVLSEFADLRSVLAPVVDHLEDVYRSWFAGGEGTPAERFDRLWPSILLAIGSELTRQAFSRVAEAERAEPATRGGER